MSSLATLVASLFFALGLLVGGMTDPAKVIGFLDIFGDWDPSLAFVMGGAVGINVITFRTILKRPNPLLSEAFHLPGSKLIDRKLLLGSLLFGVGWGMAGFCPGPALVSLGTGTVKVVIFVAAMLVGMVGYDRAFARA